MRYIVLELAFRGHDLRMNGLHRSISELEILGTLNRSPVLAERRLLRTAFALEWLRPYARSQLFMKDGDT